MMMKPIARIFTLISLGGLMACQAPDPAPREKLNSGESDHLTAAVLWLQKAETARLICEQAYQYAWLRLESQLDSIENRDSLAVVLDLDETVLDNSPYEARIIQAGTKFEKDSWAQWENEAQADLIPGAGKFLHKVDSAGLQIFYISNRSAQNLAATLQNLRNLKVPQADSSRLFLKEESSDKTARREKVREHYQIVLLIGDQPGDFSANFAAEEANLKDKIVVLPNPMYGDFMRLSDSLKNQHPSFSEALKSQLNTKK